MRSTSIIHLNKLRTIKKITNLSNNNFKIKKISQMTTIQDLLGELVFTNKKIKINKGGLKNKFKTLKTSKTRNKKTSQTNNYLKISKEM